MVPQTFVQAGGTVKYDLIGTGFAGLYLISERIESILKSNGITGWETFRVNVFDNENKRINGYFGFSIKGRCGILDDSKSVTVQKENKFGVAYKVKRGLYFDPTAWDKTDIFSPDGKMFIFVTERVVRVLEKLKNINFHDISQIEMMVS